MSKTVYTLEEWQAEGRRRFGKEIEDWKFKCPRCGNVATGKEYKDAGAEPDDMYQTCIGRHTEEKGCDWAAFGLFDICKVHVKNGDKEVPVFEFGEEE
jgi:hypothetical protein